MIPYRVELVGGWGDDPDICPTIGSVIVISIKPKDYQNRSGLSSGTREQAKKLWGEHLPPCDPIVLANALYTYENISSVAGSQDAYGICLPGVNRLDYNGKHLPHTITRLTQSSETWLEDVLRLYLSPPRPNDYDPIKIVRGSITEEISLYNNTMLAWGAIEKQDINQLSYCLANCFRIQQSILPLLPIPEEGLKWTGAGYGYQIGFLEGGEKIKIRR